MHEMKVLTVRDVSFTDDSGREVSGQQLWLTAPIADSGWRHGFEVLKLWISDGSPLSDMVAILGPNDVVRIEFNRRGKPQQIVLA